CCARTRTRCCRSLARSSKAEDVTARSTPIVRNTSWRRCAVSPTSLSRRSMLLLLPTAGAIYETAAVAADPLRLNADLGLYTNFVNLLDLAAIALPAGFRNEGLPFGVSLMAPAFADRALLD